MATFIEGVTDIFPQPKLFTPDFSFIDKMLKRKEAMYEEGFSKLNNQYNLINREVTNPANAAMRDQFLKQAKANLKDLATLDLSDGSNVSAAAEVFKPFYTNRNIIGDQNITQHWNQQLAIGNSFRLKDGGKEFSQDNLDYIVQQRMAFAGDDPSTVDDYINSKRYYTPYYDYNKEIKDAMKEFKPNHTKIDKLDGMYVKTVEDQSWNALDISRYLNSVLSDKAKSQMRIESAVRIGNNPSSVAQVYMQTEGAQIPALNTVISKIDDSLKTEKDPNKIQELQKYKEYYEDQRREIGNNLKVIRSGDVSFIKKNFEPLTYKSYYNSLVQKIANGYSHSDIEQSIKGDDVAMMYFREDQQWKRMYYQESRADARQARADERADRRERLKAEAERTKDWTEPIPVEMTGSDLELYKTGLENKFKESDDARNAAYSNLMSRIGKDLGKSASQITESEFNTWITNPDNKNSTLYKGYVNAHEAYQIQKQALQLNNQSEDDYIRSQVGDDNYKLYKSINDIYKNVSNLNQQEKNAVSEGRKRFFDLKLPEVEAAKALNINPQQVKDIIESVNSSKKQYKQKAAEGTTLNVTGFTLGAGDPRYKKTQSYIESLYGVKDAKGINYFPESDPSKFVVSFDVDTQEDADAIIAKVTAGGRGRVATYNSTTKKVFITGVGENMAKELDPYYGITGNHRQALRNVEIFDGKVDSRMSTAPLNVPDYAGINHVVMVVKNIYNGFDSYDLIIDGKKVPYDFNNAPTAYKAANVILQDPNKIDFLSQ